MANRWAVATGNWSSLSTWDGGASLPGDGDTVCANTYTVTIDQDVTVGTITTAAAGSGVAGGSFVLSAGRVVTANIQAGSTDCLTFASGTSTIVGTITGSATTNTTNSVNVTGGTLNITGDVYGGIASSQRVGLKITSGSPTVNITGTVGRISTQMNSAAVWIATTGNATVNVTGNVIGGNADVGISVSTVASSSHTVTVSGNVNGGIGSNTHGITIVASTTITVTVGGNVTAGSAAATSHGIYVGSSANMTMTITGNVYSTNYGNGILSGGVSPGVTKILGNADSSGSTTTANRAVETNSSSIVWVVGNAIQGPLAAAVGVAAGAASSITRIDGNIVGNSVGQGVRIWGILYVNSYTDNTMILPNSVSGSVSAAGTSVTLYGAAAGGSGQASQADVRHGTVYGPSNELTGTCYVPSAASVLYGVNVDATTGTATITAASIAAAVWDAARSGHATPGSYGATSEWAGSLPSEAPANWIKSTSINAGALNGKGDWATSTQGTSIQNKTDQMTFTGGRIDASLAAAVLSALFEDIDTTSLTAAIIDAIETNLDAGDLSVQAIATACRDAILNQVLAGNHDTSGTTGKLLQDAATSSASAASSAASAASDTTSILAKIGDFAGSGVNTVLGFFKALLRKDASTPSDVGGTFNPATDSVEALQSAIAGISGGTGTGARSVTITVNDGTSPLETAKVRVTQGAETYLGTTNSSGVTTFSLDDATWTVRVTKPGYTLAVQTLVVNGTETVTYSMTAVSVTTPSDPSLSRLVATCYGTDGQPEEGVKVHFQMTSGTGDAGIVHDSGVKTITSNASGELKVDSEWPEFVIGATYRARRGNVGQWVEKTIPDADSFTWGEILGSP